MKANSRFVETNQNGVHDRLVEVLERHARHPFLKPVAKHTELVFESVCDVISKHSERGLVLDSGCGTGESTIKLGKTHPNDWVIGIDQSQHRLAKSGWRHAVFQCNNVLLLRAELVDFWILAEKRNWKLKAHYLLYPNPWPKSMHLKRRWHAHPVFPVMLTLGGLLELRTNWLIYAQEFVQALTVLTSKDCKLESYSGRAPLTPFETKYIDSGHSLHRVICNLR